jgi:hypothetical protein
MWYQKLSNFVIEQRFNWCDANANVFIKHFKEGFVNLTIYVDDDLVVNNQLHLVFELKKFLNNFFEMSYQSELQYFLKPKCCEIN